jgi:hypothetical protein
MNLFGRMPIPSSILLSKLFQQGVLPVVCCKNGFQLNESHFVLVLILGFSRSSTAAQKP